MIGWGEFDILAFLGESLGSIISTGHPLLRAPATMISRPMWTCSDADKEGKEEEGTTESCPNAKGLPPGSRVLAV